MSRFEAWLLHAATALVGGTGLVYAWMRYLARPTDPYAVVNHPLQPLVQHLHIWLAPLLIFAVGVIWQSHVVQRWRREVHRCRWSGVSLLLTVAPMVASGYLLQTAVSPAWRTAWLAVHLTTSGLWLAAYPAHLLQRARRGAPSRRRTAEPVSPPPVPPPAMTRAVPRA